MVDRILLFDMNSPEVPRKNSRSCCCIDKPNIRGELVGDVVGYAGLQEVTAYRDRKLDRSSITGYL
jgi:hypothetical protein